MVSAPRPASASLLVPTTSFPLYHVPKDKVGASKKALIQVGLMCDRLKEAYDASVALQTNVRVSTIVSMISSRNFSFFSW